MKEKKKKYVESFINKKVQTLNKFYKNKFAQIASVEKENAEVSVSAWEIFDEYDHLRMKEEREREEREQITVQTKNEDEENDEESKDMDEAVNDDGDNSETSSIRSNGSTERRSFILSPHFKEHLMTMERMVVQNQFHVAQEEYKDFTLKKMEEPVEEQPVKQPEKKDEPKDEELDEIDKYINNKEPAKEEEKVEKEPVCRLIFISLYNRILANWKRCGHTRALLLMVIMSRAWHGTRPILTFWPQVMAM